MEISVHKLPLKLSIDLLRESASKSEILKEFMERYAASLEERGIEVWHKEANFIVTEEGYKWAKFHFSNKN